MQFVFELLLDNLICSKMTSRETTLKLGFVRARKRIRARTKDVKGAENIDPDERPSSLPQFELLVRH